MEKFRGWLNENNFVTKVILDEVKKVSATEAPQGKKITANQANMNKYPEYLKELEAVAGKIVFPEIGYTDPDFQGLFYKKDAGVNIYVSKGSDAHAALAGSDKARFEVINGKECVVFTFDDGNYTVIKTSGKADIAKADGSGSTDQLGNTTDLQESITSAIMTLNINGFQFPAAKNKKFKSHPVTEWLIESDVVNKTGIWKYVDAKVSDPEKFKQQFTDWLIKYKDDGTIKWKGWSSNFEYIAKENWRSRISAMFKDNKPTWENAIVVHDRNLIAGINRALLQKYLAEDRFGAQKDLLDKTDTVLAFNGASSCNNLIKQVLSTKSPEEHNELLNRLVNEVQLVGISLKQVASTVNVAAVNFKNFNILTTAVGDNINDEYKVCVRYDTGSGKTKQDHCTFKIGSATILPQQKEDATNFRVRIDCNPHDLHLKDNQYVELQVRNHNGVNIAFIPSGANAKFGDANSQFDKYDEIGNITVKYNALTNQGMSLRDATKQIAEMIVDFFNKNPLALHEIFAKTAGYPLLKTKNGKNPDYNLSQAPYIKIY